MSTRNYYARRISVQSPTLLEPVFTSVVVNDVDILSQPLPVSSNSNYNNPSIDEILQNHAKACYLGLIYNNADFQTTPILLTANSNALEPDLKFELLSGELPPGLAISSVTSSSIAIIGVVNNLPVTTTAYPFVLRITNNENIHIDHYFYFNVMPPKQELRWDYPTSTHYLGPVYRGSSVSFVLQIVNTLNKPLTYSITPDLPNSLSIVNDSIVGVLDPVIPIGSYNFIITASDGKASTSADVFSFDITAGSSLSLHSSSIVWQTKDLNLGDTYTLLPSHFGVKATNSNNVPITYVVSPNSAPLPESLSLQSTTGNITGITPFVNSIQKYTITIRASIDQSFNDRTFTFRVLPQYHSTTVFSAYLPVEEPAKLAIEEGVWNAFDIRDELLFRPEQDDYFGRVLHPRILLEGRSVTTSNPNNFKSTLQQRMLWYLIGVQPDYSGVVITNSTEVQLSVESINIILGAMKNNANVLSNALASLGENFKSIQLTKGDLNLLKEAVNINSNKLKLKMGKLGVVAVYSPDGRYIYDVIYANIQDPQAGADGWVDGVETPLYETKLKTPIRLYPKSLNNLRQDWLSLFDQHDLPGAGLPLSQRGSSGGWKATIDLLFTIPGAGQNLLFSLVSKGFEQLVLSKEITTGRLVIPDQITSTTAHQCVLGTFILGKCVLGL